MGSSMRTSRLGRSSVSVGELGFGGGQLGGLFESVDDGTAATALAAAWDVGIRHVDTSPHARCPQPGSGRARSRRPIGPLVRFHTRSGTPGWSGRRLPTMIDGLLVGYLAHQ
jgi:D-threo-aldose 1-dehydrogenase